MVRTYINKLNNLGGNMKKIYFKDLKEYKGKEIEVQGFIDNIKNLKYVQFVILRDGTGKLQVTIEKNDS